MPTPDDTRRSVADAYTQAVNAPAPTNSTSTIPSDESASTATCCEPTCCQTEAAVAAPEQKGIAVKSAGYNQASLAGLPADAVVNSFGCGNPLAFAGVREGEIVVDLGSGAGIDVLLASKMVGDSGRVIGVDMTPAMIERARANIVEANVSNVEIREGVIEQLPIEDASVDWVISNCVINLSPEKDRVFAEIARVLRPGGRFSISDIVVDHLPDEIRALPGVYNSCIGGAISEAQYLAGLEQAGLSGVEVTERLTYDTAQLAALVQSELSEGGCCSGAKDEPGATEVANDLLRSVRGGVHSLRITGQKPE